MDGDGDEELVAHWGVLHPDQVGSRQRLLSKMTRTGERLRREQEYDNVHPFTLTNKYIMQKGVAGRFKENTTGMFTVYGDDMYYVNYNLSRPLWPGETSSRFRVTDYVIRTIIAGTWVAFFQECQR